MLTESVPRAPPAVVGIGIVWIQPKDRVVVGYGGFMLTKNDPRQASVVVGEDIIRVQTEHCIISIYCSIEIGFIFALKKIADRKPSLNLTLSICSFCGVSDGTPFFNGLAQSCFAAEARWPRRPPGLSRLCHESSLYLQHSVGPPPHNVELPSHVSQMLPHSHALRSQFYRVL